MRSPNASMKSSNSSQQPKRYVYHALYERLLSLHARGKLDLSLLSPQLRLALMNYAADRRYAEYLKQDQPSTG